MVNGVLLRRENLDRLEEKRQYEGLVRGSPPESSGKKLDTNPFLTACRNKQSWSTLISDIQPRECQEIKLCC